MDTSPRSGQVPKQVVERMRAALERSTVPEKKRYWYLVWARRFLGYLGASDIGQCGPGEIVGFLQAKSNVGRERWHLEQAVDAIVFLLRAVGTRNDLSAEELKREIPQTAGGRIHGGGARKGGSRNIPTGQPRRGRGRVGSIDVQLNSAQQHLMTVSSPSRRPAVRTMVSSVRSVTTATPTRLRPSRMRTTPCTRRERSLPKVSGGNCTRIARSRTTWTTRIAR